MTMDCEYSDSHCTVLSVQVMNIRKLLTKIEKPHGLYPNFLSPVSGNWVQRKYRVSWELRSGDYRRNMGSFEL